MLLLNKILLKLYYRVLKYTMLKLGILNKVLYITKVY